MGTSGAEHHLMPRPNRAQARFQTDLQPIGAGRILKCRTLVRMAKRPKIRHSRRGGPEREHMRIRRALFERVIEIAKRDHLSAADIAHMCGTSRSRAHSLLRGQIASFNSETLIDILFRVGVDVDLQYRTARAYRKMEFPDPRAKRLFVEPWRA